MSRQMVARYACYLLDTDLLRPASVELLLIHRPHGSLHILHTREALVQTEVMPDSILCKTALGQCGLIIYTKTTDIDSHSIDGYSSHNVSLLISTATTMSVCSSPQQPQYQCAHLNSSHNISLLISTSATMSVCSSPQQPQYQSAHPHSSHNISLLISTAATISVCSSPQKPQCQSTHLHSSHNISLLISTAATISVCSSPHQPQCQSAHLHISHNVSLLISTAATI